MSAGTVTFDADEYLELLDELTDLEKRLRNLGKDDYNFKGSTTKLEAQCETRALEVQDLADQVFSKLPWPHEKGKLTPINDAMTLVGVHPPLRRDVRDAVLRRILTGTGRPWRPGR